MVGRVTIHDVAKAAKVSPSTISNYLNGRSERMNPKTRRRVEGAIAKLGYRPSKVARQLRTGHATTIGLVVPSVANPFWGAFARHLERNALAEGFHLLLCNSQRDPDREREYVEQLFADGVRGVVLGSSRPEIDHLAPLLDKGLSIVAFDRTPQATDPPGLVNISVDNVVGAELATSHLLDLGHERIAFVSGTLDSLNRRARYRGFCLALERAGHPPVPAWAASEGAYGDRDIAELGKQAALELLQSPTPPTAIVAVNDLCAFGVCAGARAMGVEVGRQLSVTGFDDIVLADLTSPPLTTVRQPLSDLSAAAFEHLAAAINGAAPQGRSITMRPELIVRGTTAPPA
jgi:DNA-binding LacI/PurR family transcriptional regulator